MPRPYIPRLDSLVFIAVLLTSLWAVYSISNHSMGSFGMEQPSALAIVGIPSSLGDTIVIAGLNLNEAIGADISSLTDLHLSSLQDGVASTASGSTHFRQTLRFAQTGTDAFTSGTVRFSQDDSGSVGDFLVFGYGTPIFEYELLFDQGLESKIESGSLPDIQDSSIAFMGQPSTIFKASVAGNAVDLRLFTPGGDVQIRDSDVTDSLFERAVKVNGRTINAQVRIQASVSGASLRINRINYRLLAYPRFGGDMYVAPKRGVRQYLSEPEAMINPSLDIIYGGIRGQSGQIAGSGNPSSSLGGGNLFFDPSGGQRYDIIFTNLAGQLIKVPFVSLVSGTPTLGNGKQSLVVREGSSTSDFNINAGDYFIATSANDVNGFTNVVVYSGLSRTDNALFFDVMGMGRTQVRYDSATGKGSLNVGGFTYDVYLDLSSTDRIVVDQNNDGSFSGATARIVSQGGAQIEPGASSTTLRMARKLFENPPSSDETTTINFAAEGSKITAQVPSQSSLTLRTGSDRINRGMTQYGVQFILDDRHAPSKLSMDIPRNQRAPRVSIRSSVGRVSKGAQVGAYVAITMERERFIPTRSLVRKNVDVGVND